MQYIIFDLEFNQGFENEEKDCPMNENLPFEIMQVGAVKLDGDFRMMETFDRFVKPKVYHKMNPFVAKLTNISINQLEKSDGFEKVYQDFLRFIGNEEPVLCIWGASDLKVLHKNLQFHKINPQKLTNLFINVQTVAALYFGFPKSTMMSLRNALEFLSIPVESKLHDAYSDAFYTAEIWKKIHGPHIKPELYDPRATKITRQQTLRRVVDMPKLLLQFEKMYQRELTEDEKSMIELAYKMGQTQQFLVHKKAIEGKRDLKKQ